MNTTQKIKVTWELSEAAAREAIMRAGGDPREAGSIQGAIRLSRFSQKYASGASFGATSELQAAGYRVVGLEIVDA